MEHVEYVYTSGMSESEADSYLRAGEHGVLGLAHDNDAYAIPLSYHYDGDQFLLRVSEHDDDSEKGRFIETTETATFVCYEASTNESWSILVRGHLQRWEKDIEEETIDEWFQPFRLFDETIESVEFSLYSLRMETVIGRKTVE
jgi:nitroimidazol reductase NimA-like FMN-containing flavoprotein (pyridoxamine 5'-phosphate oxidase superfamily)